MHLSQLVPSLSDPWHYYGAAVTSALLVASVVSKLVVLEAHVTSRGVLLLQRALYWRDVADAEAPGAAQFEHYAMALAFVYAARELATDTDLEWASGVEVGRALKHIERRLGACREAAKRREKGGGN